MPSRADFLPARALYADDIVHHLLSPTTEIGRQVIHLLGEEVQIGNNLDRQKIANQVFANLATLDALEKILHPAVVKEIETRYQQICHEHRYPLFVVEIPLLAATGTASWYDAIITVVANPAQCQKRFDVLHPHLPDQFDLRMKRQNLTQPITHPHQWMIENNGSIEELKKNVATMYCQLLML